MRAPEQGGEVAAKELGGWGRAQEETREAGLGASRPLLRSPIPRALLRDLYVQGRASPLAHTCPGRGRLPLSHLTPAPVPRPPCLWPALQGWCH